MADDPVMPSALEIAGALAQFLEEKLSDPGAEQIVLSRQEAVLCLGLINGVAENLEVADQHSV